MIEMTGDGVGRSISFAALDADVRRTAAGLVAHGVRHGDRVALLIPPGIDLTVCLYACWRMGAVVVAGRRGPRRPGDQSSAQERNAEVPRSGFPRARGRGARPGVAGRAASRPSPLPERGREGARGHDVLDAIRGLGDGKPASAHTGGLRPAAVIFTSGATGPAKGVVYRHHQLQAQRDVLARALRHHADDRFVAAFAPFALYGPAMGVPSVVPEMRRDRAGHAARRRAGRGGRRNRCDARVRVAGRACAT